MPRPRARSSRRSRSRIAALLLAAALASGVTAGDPVPPAGAAAPASEGEVRPSGLVEKAAVRLSLLEIVVLDSKGRHVRGLPKSAFRVFERGQELPVASVDEVDLVPPAEPTRAASPTSPGETTAPVEKAAPPAAAPPPAVPSAFAERRRSRPRWFLMLFDGYNNPSALRVNELRRVAKRWLGDNLRPQDFAAVYEMVPNLSSVNGFTSNVVDLRLAIDKVRIFPGSDVRDEQLRKVLDQGKSMGGSESARQVMEQQLVNAAEFGGDLLSRERDQFYLDLADAANIFSGVEGTKAILLFSGGFPLTRTRSTEARGGLTPRFKSMLESLEREGIRVFTFDVGEEGGFTDASKAQNMSQMLDQLEFGQEWLERLGVGGEVDTANAHQEILSVLGSETGGRFLRGRDYGAGLDAAADDLSHYYVLGYEPRDDPEGRSYVPVRVDVAGRGLRVVTRKGRFVEEKLEAEAAAAAMSAAAVEAAAVENRGKPSPEPTHGLSLACRPLFYPQPDGRTLVVLPVEIAGPIPAVISTGGSLDLDLDLTVSAKLSAADVRTSRRNVRARLRPEAKAALERGLQVRDAIVLPAGIAEISVSIRLNGLDRAGTWSARLPVPVRTLSPFGLTDLALLDPGKALPVVFDVFGRAENVSGTIPPSPLADPLGADARGRPPAYVAGPFSRAVPLLVQIGVVSAPRADASGSSPLRMDWELVPADGGAPFVPPVKYRRLAMQEDGTLDVVAELDVKGLREGDWVLRLSAENLATRSKDQRTTHVSIASSAR